MNRLDRLTAILTQLQSKKWIRATEIADRFEITIRTVYRDIRALEEAGVPIVSEAGRGYSLVDGYRLPPIMFTKEEALSFIVAEKLLTNFTDKESGGHFSSALFKIKSVLREAEKELMEQFSDQVAVIGSRDSLNGKSETFLHVIQEALSKNLVLEMEYHSFENEETTRRHIEPVGIYYAFEQWYLIAWCRLRKAYRTFRTDRAKKVKLIEKTFKSSHPTLKDYLTKEQEKNQLIKVVIALPVSAMKYLRVQKYNQGFVMEKIIGDEVEMTFMTTSLESFVRWILMMADTVLVKEPVQLKEMIRGILEKGILLCTNN
ncbi:helix-turn-helix transcriptional regulator [Litoribacter populi]|uniref:helix-turn-helix transcriptional regulator n=1 Tax=Litoribacter populi TaxID=2598460 RepID=UPI0011804B22|nr:YafY family protein [Litoribacter populi]